MAQTVLSPVYCLQEPTGRARLHPPPTMILSIHIPKTAGVRFRDLLRERFGAGLILHYYHITDAAGRVLSGI